MTKNFSLCIPVLGQQETVLETLDSFYSNAKYPNDIPLILIDNGSNPPVYKWIIPFIIKFPLVKIVLHRNEENVGVPKALNQGWQIAEENCCNPDFIYFSHSDVKILEKDWDEKVRNWISQSDTIGVLGFGGSPGIGLPGLYGTEYNIINLQRHMFLSNMLEAENHGLRMQDEFLPAVVLDGFCLIVNVKVLRNSNGFDEHYIFHGYDNDICLEAIRQGYYNFILNISCHHQGGVTSTRPDYQEWAHKYGSDNQIHKDAHVYFYEKWRDLLPCMIRFNWSKYKTELKERYNINV